MYKMLLIIDITEITARNSGDEKSMNDVFEGAS